MITVKKEGILLTKTSLPFENEGILNPGAIREGKFVHLFYRAVSVGNHSSIGYCKLNGPLAVGKRLEKPLLVPEFAFESRGMEDPRIVKIEDLYYLTYTAFDGMNAIGALAVSKDLIHFEKKGIIVPQIKQKEFIQLMEAGGKNIDKYKKHFRDRDDLDYNEKTALLWDKNVILFPRKIEGKFYLLHRIKPDIVIVESETNFEDLTAEFWKKYLLNIDEHIVMSSKHEHEISYIGGGCPPIETELGWLFIYHGVHETAKGFIYCACAALLDLKNPKKEIARLPYPLFKPEHYWELKGLVKNVCFPTGAVVFDDILYIYYGAGDEQIACASISLSGLLTELKLYTIQDEK